MWFSRSFLFLWLLILPLSFVTTLNWYAIPISILIAYELLGCEVNSVSIVVCALNLAQILCDIGQSYSILAA